jgi:hypothetical protein
MKAMKGPGPIAVTVERATLRDITQTVSATGKIRPEAEIKISSEVAGEIVDLPVVDGQSVKRGDVLVKIKPDNYIASHHPLTTCPEIGRRSLTSSRRTLLLLTSSFSVSGQFQSRKSNNFI